MKRNKHNKIATIILMVAIYFLPVMLGSINSNGFKQQNLYASETQTMRPMVFRMLEKAQEAIDAKNYSEGKAELDKLSKMNRNSYEQAMTHNIYAYYHFSQDDYKSAISSYNKILELKVPDSTKQNTLYSLAKLHMALEQYPKAIESLSKWMQLTKTPNSEAHIMLAQSYLQLNDEQMALIEIKKGIQIARDEGRMIKENWYLLARAIYYQQNDYQGLEKTLKELVAFYPKTEYWLQLSAVYDELNQVGRSLAVLETAYDKGYFKKESELMSFANLLLQVEIPYKAARVIDQGIKDKIIESNSKHLSILADAWMLAKEYDKAIEVLEASVEIAETGEQAYKLAQVYMEKNEWEKSGILISKAIQQGKLKDEGNAWLIQGLAHFNQKQLDSAVTAFNKARKFEKQSKTAEQWLDYVQQEKARLEYIKSFENS